MQINSTTTGTVVFQSERITVVRVGPKDHELLIDGEYKSRHDFAFQAQHEGLIYLTEEAQHVAVDTADMAADMAALEVEHEAMIGADAQPVSYEQQQRLLSHKAATARVVARAVDLIAAGVTIKHGKIDVSLSAIQALKVAVEAL